MRTTADSIRMGRSNLPGKSAVRRWDVALRTVIAVIGGYVFSSLIAAAIARFLPGDRANAALTGTMLSFAVFPVIVMWAFGAQRAWLVLAMLTGASALLAALIAWSVTAGGQL